MADLKDVLEDVQREVKSYGDDIASLKTSMERDLKNVRDLAEKAGKSATDNSQLKNDLDVLSRGVAEKHAALEASVKRIQDESLAEAKRATDELERKLNRMRTGGTASGDDEFKHAREFAELKALVNKDVKAGQLVSEDDVDVEEFKSYGAAFKRLVSNRQGDRGLSADEQKSLSVGSSPEGGFLVTPAVSARTLEIVRESSPMMSLATIEMISSSELEIAIDEDEADAYWAGEQEDRRESNTPQVGVQKIPVHELIARPKATMKFIEDAGINVPAWLSRKIGEKFSRVSASGFVVGNGVKKPRGFTTYADGVVRNTIEQVASGHASQVTFDGLIKLTSALKGPYKANANFLMKRTSVGSVMLLKDSNGQYLWRPNNQAGQPSLLLGYKVAEAEDMPGVASGALPIAFGDFKAGYTIVMRRDMTVLVDPYSKKPFVEYYTTMRLGGDVTTFEAIKLQKISA